jgi:hypothetical protein
MRHLPWTPGPAEREGTVFVSATRFTYRRFWHMPFVFWHGLALRRQWGRVEGAIGMLTGASLFQRTTYTVSAWTTERDLQRWIGSRYHAHLMKDYRGYVESAGAASWLTEVFEPHAAWREALARLGAPAASRRSGTSARGPR